MKTIHKSTIGIGIGQTYVDVEMPYDYHAVHVAWQKAPNDVIDIWYYLDTNNPKVGTVRFEAFETGQEIPDRSSFIGTAVEPDSDQRRDRTKLVLHVLRVPPK